ncbi:MAG: hypothetical protein H0W64_02600 [Gammaproteobacteria bacterium]|nr:hypothetical protein [Gammaproteobacteria bacterium]
MRSVLENLIRNPNFISIYRFMGRTISLIFSVVFLPILCFIALASTLFSKTIEQSEKEQGVLTQEKIEQLILQWIDLHRNKLKSVTKKIIETAYDSHLEIHIIPINNKSLPIKFRMGDQILFGMILGNHYYLEYDSENGMGSNSLNQSELNYLLNAYLQGDYYIREWFIDEKKIGGKIYIKNIRGKYTASFNSDASNLELKLAEKRNIHFAPL